MSTEHHLLQVGEVVFIDGDRWVVPAVGRQSARLLTTLGATRTIKRDINPYFLIPKTPMEGNRELELCLNLNAAKRDILTKPISEEEENAMSTKATPKRSLKNPVGTDKPIKKPRGGLAAAAAATETAKAATKTTPETKPATAAPAKKTTKAEKPHKGLGKLFDCSVVRVVQALGKAGAKFDDVMATLKKKGFTPSESTVKQNIAKGKRGIEGMAVLNKTQLAEFGV